MQTYLVGECGEEGNYVPRKKIEALAKRSDARTLGIIMSSNIIAVLRLNICRAQSIIVTQWQQILTEEDIMRLAEAHMHQSSLGRSESLSTFKL